MSKEFTVVKKNNWITPKENLSCKINIIVFHGFYLANISIVA